MLKIVIPMAGRGSRFAIAGYVDPKPLIPIKGIPMIKLVIDNLRPVTPHQFIFICQRHHVRTYDLGRRLAEWAPGCELVQIDGVTDGAACTVLAAEALIGRGPLMIANSDQYIDASIDAYLADLADFDGLIMTMTAHDPKWSFVGLSSTGLVARVAEKQPISAEATVGIYNFASGVAFIEGARAMIAAGLRVNNEFYVAPVYEQLIAKGARIAIRNIGAEGAGMYGLGTPADLDVFLHSSASGAI